MAKIRIGIIGLGNIGKVHKNCLQKLAGAKITAVCDVRDETVNTVAGELKAEGFNDYKKLCQSKLCDLAVVATDHFRHFPITMEALKNNLHVFCEKPITVRIADAKLMVAAAKKKRRMLAINYLMRHRPEYVKIREIVKSGKIGNVLRGNFTCTEWFRNMAYYRSSDWRGTWKGEGGGLLLNQLPHDLDFIYWLLGEPKTITGMARTLGHDIEVEDDVSCRLDYANGCEFSFQSNTWEAPGTTYMYLTGDKGALSFTGDKIADTTEIKMVQYPKPLKQYIEAKDMQMFAPKTAQWKPVKVAKSTNWLPDTWKGVLGYLQGGKNAEKHALQLCLGEESLGSLRIANGTLFSAIEGKTIPFNFCTRRFNCLLDDLTSGKKKLPRGKLAL
jgi:predicted dehydrogenase